MLIENITLPLSQTAALNYTHHRHCAFVSCICRWISRTKHSAARDVTQRTHATTGRAFHKERDRHALSDATAVYHTVDATTVSAAHAAVPASCPSDSALALPATGYVCMSLSLFATEKEQRKNDGTSLPHQHLCSLFVLTQTSRLELFLT